MSQILPLSCDWLALSLTLECLPSGCPDGHRWAVYSPTNVWASRWCLFNEYGEKVFTLLFQPRQSIIAHNAALLEVANEWLYHGIGLTSILDLLGQVCRFRIGGISRLDLAVDFNPTDSQAAVIRGLADTSLYVAGKRNGSGFWSVVRDAALSERWQGRCPHCQSWGHKTSDVKWKLYYKSKELRDAAGGFGWDKPYIVDMWREVGLDERDVWRLEVSVKHCNNFMFMGEPLTYERWRSTGSDLFQSLYTDRFSVARDEGHRDRSNDERVPFLPVGECRGAFRCKVHDTLTEHNGRLTLLRHLVSDIQREEVLLSDVAREACMDALEQCLEQDRFQRYFREVVGSDFDDWREWCRVKAYYFGEEYIDRPADQLTVANALLSAGIVDPDTLSVLNPPSSHDA